MSDLLKKVREVLQELSADAAVDLTALRMYNLPKVRIWVQSPSKDPTYNSLFHRELMTTLSEKLSTKKAHGALNEFIERSVLINLRTSPRKLTGDHVYEKQDLLIDAEMRTLFNQIAGAGATIYQPTPSEIFAVYESPDADLAFRHSLLMDRLSMNSKHKHTETISTAEYADKSFVIITTNKPPTGCRPYKPKRLGTYSLPFRKMDRK